MLLEFIKTFHGFHSFHGTVTLRSVDVKPPSPARVWKTRSGNSCKIRVNMLPLRKEDRVWISRTKEQLDNGYEQVFTDSSWNSEKGSDTHVLLHRLQSPSYQGDVLLQWTLKSEHCWGQNLQNCEVSSGKKGRNKQLLSGVAGLEI